jgi:hypothetical protein
MPFHANRPNVPSIYPPATADNANRNIEGDLAEAIGGKKIIRTSIVLAQDYSC